MSLSQIVPARKETLITISSRLRTFLIEILRVDEFDPKNYKN
jgi:hypothetical protein